MTLKSFTIRPARWPEDEERLRLVREKVFVDEQKVPPELEWDGLDAGCFHLLAEDPRGNAIGTARLLPDGHIGRMAVLKSWRGQGVGKALLLAVMEEGRRRGFDELALNAQLTALPFYEKAGFRAVGAVFEDAGIPHRRMVWRRQPPC